MAKVTVLGSLVLHAPEQARKIIAETVRKYDGNVVHAAEGIDPALGGPLSHRQLCRLIDKLGMHRDVDLIRIELGKNPGRPLRRRKK